MTKFACSACNMEFDDKDPDFEARKIRHAEKHTNIRTTLNGKKVTVNNSIQTISWVRIW